MTTLHELATLTSKGQITLPKSIRQALSVDTGARIAFDLHEDGSIVLTRAEVTHQDPAIGAFLDLLAVDIQTGNIQTLPQDLLKAMQNAGHPVSLDEPIDGEVVI
jgi:antitoxin PrlF